MADPYNISKTLQEDIKRRFLENETLAPLDIISQEILDIDNAIQSAIKKLGIVLIINVPEANAKHPNLPGPVFDEIKFSVDIIELTITNRNTTGTGVTALNAAFASCSSLHHFRPSINGGAIYCDNPTIQFVEDKTFLIYRTNFKIGD